MSVLTKDQIYGLLTDDAAPLEERLCITPILDAKLQISEGSVDLRLANDFVTVNRSGLVALDPVKESQLGRDLTEYQTSSRQRFGQPFYLHPRMFALASTLEYVCLPPQLMGYVIGRSSWGRLGLVIATATMARAGFKGNLTLELANVGTLPIALYPCARIAQLVLHRLGPE
ncbi:MAG: dCTP deaminase [Candidatus Eisenbacteria bacterium]